MVESEKESDITTHIYRQVSRDLSSGIHLKVRTKSQIDFSPIALRAKCLSTFTEESQFLPTTAYTPNTMQHKYNIAQSKSRCCNLLRKATTTAKTY